MSALRAVIALLPCLFEPAHVVVVVPQVAGRRENVVGWYHSHPGYGCWLSGIDCSTQMMNQQFQEPWLAVVVDPVRTMASGDPAGRRGLILMHVP